MICQYQILKILQQQISQTQHLSQLIHPCSSICSICFALLLAHLNVSFYIFGCHGCQQMEREDVDSVSQIATPCKYLDVSCGTTEMDQDGSVLMKAVL